VKLMGGFAALTALTVLLFLGSVPIIRLPVYELHRTLSSVEHLHNVRSSFSPSTPSFVQILQCGGFVDAARAPEIARILQQEGVTQLAMLLAPSFERLVERVPALSLSDRLAILDGARPVVKYMQTLAPDERVRETAWKDAMAHACTAPAEQDGLGWAKAAGAGFQARGSRLELDASLGGSTWVTQEERLRRPAVANDSLIGTAGEAPPLPDFTKPQPRTIEIARGPFFREDHVCADVMEKAPVLLRCPSKSQVMTRVEFASFGRPEGFCQHYQIGSCHAKDTQVVVEEWCLGQYQCSFDATVALFGDPCFNVLKEVSVQVLCGGEVQPTPPPPRPPVAGKPVASVDVDALEALEPQHLHALFVDTPIPEGLQIHDVDGLVANILYINTEWRRKRREMDEAGRPRVATITTTACGFADVVREVFPWLQYHVAVGLAKVFMFYDGQDSDAKLLLRQLEPIHLVDTTFEDRHFTNGGNWMLVDEPPASLLERFNDSMWWRQDESGRLWERVGGRAPDIGLNFTMSKLDRWTPEFGFNRPGNYKLMIKQSFNLQEGIHRAQEYRPRMDWVVHHDIDELLYPGPSGCRGMTARQAGACQSRRDHIPEGFSVPELFARQPPHVGQIQLFNNEAKVEKLGIELRFEEQTLFARNGIFREDHEKAKNPSDKGMIGGAQGYLVYTNGKAAARLTDALQQWGAHAFKSQGRKFVSEQYTGPPVSLPYDPQKMGHLCGNHPCHRDEPDAAILHYPYSRFAELKQKASRSCPFLEEAMKGNEEAVKPCFIIELDRKAFMVSATNDTAKMEEFFRKKIMLQSMAPEMRKGRLVYLYEVRTILLEQHKRCPQCYDAGDHVGGHGRRLKGMESNAAFVIAIAMLSELWAPGHTDEDMAHVPTVVLDASDGVDDIVEKLASTLVSMAPNQVGLGANKIRIALAFR